MTNLLRIFKEMRGLLAATAIWLLLFGTPVLISHIFSNGRTPHPSPDPLKKFQLEREVRMLEESEYALLAIKYGLSPETTKNIIADYQVASLGISWLVPRPDSRRQSVIFPEAADTLGVVNSISKKYNVSPATIASVLIDQETGDSSATTESVLIDQEAGD